MNIKPITFFSILLITSYISHGMEKTIPIISQPTYENMLFEFNVPSTSTHAITTPDRNLKNYYNLNEVSLENSAFSCCGKDHDFRKINIHLKTSRHKAKYQDNLHNSNFFIHVCQDCHTQFAGEYSLELHKDIHINQYTNNYLPNLESPNRNSIPFINTTKKLTCCGSQYSLYTIRHHFRSDTHHIRYKNGFCNSDFVIHICSSCEDHFANLQMLALHKKRMHSFATTISAYSKKRKTNKNSTKAITLSEESSKKMKIDSLLNHDKDVDVTLEKSSSDNELAQL